MYQYKVFFYPKPLYEFIKNNIERSKQFKVKKHLDKFLYVIHHMYLLKQEFKKEYYDEDGIHINCEVLREMIGEKEDKPFRDALIQWNIIVQYSESYQAE